MSDMPAQERPPPADRTSATVLLVLAPAGAVCCFNPVTPVLGVLGIALAGSRPRAARACTAAGWAVLGISVLVVGGLTLLSLLGSYEV
ncbi:hypothetical protein [Nocardiopsis coralliicola]